MDKNLALALLKALRAAKGNAVTDAQLRKLSGLCQTEIDLAAKELEDEGIVAVERTYRLADDWA